MRRESDSRRYIHSIVHKNSLWRSSIKRLLRLGMVLGIGIMVLLSLPHLGALAEVGAVFRSLRPSGFQEVAHTLFGAVFAGAIILGILRRWDRPQKILPLERVDKMKGPEFERWCANLLRCNGFHHVSVVGRANDQGTDIIAFKGRKKYAIQCKRYSRKVNNKAVQEINAGVEIQKADVAVVMTNSYFTRSAVEAANRCDVVLWDRRKLIQFMRSARC